MGDPAAPRPSRARGGTLQGGRIHQLLESARGVTDHPVLEAVARVGLVAYGVLHLLIGWLAGPLGPGRSRHRPDPTRAPPGGARPPCGPGGALVVRGGGGRSVWW